MNFSLKRHAAILAFAAIAASTGAHAEMVQFKSGDVLTAQQLNDNFASAESRINAQADELKRWEMIEGAGALILAAIAGVAFFHRRSKL